GGTGFCRTPAGFPCQRGFGLQKPRLPEITSCRHISLLRMLQFSCMTPPPISLSAHQGPVCARMEEHCGCYGGRYEDGSHGTLRSQDCLLQCLPRPSFTLLKPQAVVLIYKMWLRFAIYNY